ncbi:pro-neuregulin-3, membrane-bound isoform-like isoform X1 [Crassostrea angulata]|uniref:pro-neuregulin-3, membrane-bound isoform-like isoform X1 n=1 Tax=Magallana angulata TaxID=2784310 RepID=UPI0022B1981A|nr:pro-neuregulin-3, membrane-bound isoform-like isoform X1 [Crassostrea angulata]XP_052685977.1 pro-neuregulin-3, membrane-bound isoform-like isoform X1 [Crassostrea angulata]XP_052685978.1 pro-neuregulin-3, membrane-bound isoform-like isoform X1 [Crassostrea angulata]XP_052685979.1 pro-neuregulin-3, membrane-bound isoform-like isoform X1 [Crassostrea angulata]XP_052685980.1 pro-neuregulin-3, membrane-bound isoform-like isoform X1 [Crassostrea angulata]XP_052685981.1 pro-neuregulin-3, membran
MHQLLPQYIIWTVCSTLFTITYGCGRTPATPRPTTAAPVTTTSFVSNRKPCTQNETVSQGCLNGGTCFVMEFEEGHRTTHCYCKENYIGKTCFYIDPTLIFQREREDHVKAAAIAASVVGIVLFVTVIVCILVLRKRYIRRKAQEKEKEKNEKEFRSQSPGPNTATNGGHQETEQLLIRNGAPIQSETRV